MSKIATAFGIQEALKELGLNEINNGTSTGKNWFSEGDIIESYSPVDGALIGKVKATTKADYEKVISTATEGFKTWRTIPAPQRGEVVRKFNDELRRLKEPLGKLVSYEMGKSYQEGLGEVQEMIDICDFAVGLSRQLHGLTMHSERPGHRMYEQYHPLGIVGVFAENGLPEGISCLITGDYKVGEMMTNDKRVPLVSATGSIRMGKIVAQAVAARLGKSLLELGGNNAIIVTPDADIKNTVIGAVFGAVGTCGQRCTSTRRLIIHESIYDKVKDAIVKAYKQLRIGNPLDENNHVGPLIDKDAVKNYQNALDKVVEEGGKILVEGGVLEGEGYESGCYVKPAIAEAKNEFKIVQHETFAPVLYIMKYSGDLENAVELQNGVVQGLSSAIMTNNLREAERFLSVEGSDCGIANVNIGTSGAEIGGAFGGEKETGGGRESGSDAWKIYMRRQTNTINYTTELPLAQGIKFDL